MNHTWNVREYFGYGNHPQQLLFLGDPGAFNTANHAVGLVTGNSTTKIMYQRLADGRVVVRSGPILPYANLTFRLFEDSMPNVMPSGDEVSTMTLGGNGLTAYYEFYNNKTGVRVHAGLGNATIATVRAPIQGLKLADGNWTPSGNTLISLRNISYLGAANITLNNVTVSNVDVGPLVTTLRVTYRGNVPLANYAAGEFPANPDGNFTCDVSLRAGEKTIRVEQTADYCANYAVPLWVAAFHPDRMRWNGYDVSNQSNYANNGYLGNTSGLDGRQAGNIAYGKVDFGFRSYWGVGEVEFIGTWRSSFLVSQITTNAFGGGENLRPYSTGFPYFNVDNGWWHAAYDSAGGNDSNLVGYCVGSVSRLVGGQCGVGFDYVTGSGANVSVNTERWYNSTSGANATLGRHAFAIVVGKKQDAMTNGWYANMTRVTNFVGGMCFDTFKDYTYDWANLSSGSGSWYLSSASINTMKTWYTTEGNIAQAWNNSGSNFEDEIGSVWGDMTGATTRQTYIDYGNMTRHVMDTMVCQGGVWGSGHGGFTVGRGAYDELAYFIAGGVVSVDTMLGYTDHSPNWTDLERTDLKHMAAFNSSLIWDPNFAPFAANGDPLTNAAGSLGTVEQVYNFVTKRDSIAFLFAEEPTWDGRTDIAIDSALTLLDASINANGFLEEPPDYGGVAAEFALNLIRNYQVTGNTTPFTDGQLTTLAQWYMNILSPPDLRFRASFGNDQGNGTALRKLMVFGDAKIRSTPYTAEVATAVRALGNEAFADVLYGAWIEGMWGRKYFNNGFPFFYGQQNSFAGTSVVKMDQPHYYSAQLCFPYLQPVNYDGQVTLHRSFWDASTECCLALVHGGGWGPSHSGNTDHGHATIYALKYPVSTEWGAYVDVPSPHSPYILSNVLPDANISGGWNNGNVNIAQGGQVWRHTSSAAFFFLAAQASVNSWTGLGSSSGDTWTRIAYFIQGILERPAFMFIDSFGGNLSTGNKVLTQLFHNGNVSAGGVAMTGVVHANDTCTPTYRNWMNGPPNQGPSFALGNATLQSGFHGWQIQGLNITGLGGNAPGLDYDYYINVTGNTSQWGVGHWSHESAYTQELQEWFAQTGYLPFRESQYLFRLRTNSSSLLSLILPKRKGQPSPTVTLLPSGFVEVAYPDGSVQYFGANAFGIITSYARMMGTGGGLDLTLADMTLYADTGAVEIVPYGTPGNYSTVYVTAHGGAGARHVKVDGVTNANYTADAGITYDAGNQAWFMSYTGPAKLTLQIRRN